MHRLLPLGAFLLTLTACCGPNVKRTAAYAEQVAARNDRLGVAATTTEARLLAEENAKAWRKVAPALLRGEELK